MIFLTTMALAQHVSVEATEVLVPADLPWEASSVGHPALWATENGFGMIFESTVEADGCVEAFQLGRASSPDGIDWTPGHQTLGPTPEFPCGHRQPVVADTSDGLFIFTRSASDGALWGHQRAEGSYSHWPTTGLEHLDSFSVARRDGVWFGVGVDPTYGITTVTSTDAVTWNPGPTTGLAYGTTWWSLDGMISPSVSCFDGTSMPYVMHYGGWTGPDTGFTYGVSDDLELWFLSLAVPVWLEEDAWDSWDSVATRSSAWVAFEQGGAIGWASTAGGMPLDAATRDCTSTP